MVRYYVIATVIIVAFGSIVFAHRFAVNGWKMHAEATGPPSTAHGNSNEGFVATPSPFFIGQGPWVMSALPSCFVQQSSKTGPSRLLHADVPQPALRIAPGTTLHRANCTVLVRPHDIWVYRGGDRLRVPPEARLYNGPEGLTLVYEHAGHTEVRVY
ncbi:MAG: hypothetical protein M3169_05070 [Candidatus Eremiobacteraeota bacterium]|nr:hypothetical protein [Candidatus Eremiobacteraeota bacterium]